MLEGGPFSYLFVVLVFFTFLRVLRAHLDRRGMPPRRVALRAAVTWLLGVFGTYWAMGLTLETIARASPAIAWKLACNGLGLSLYTLLEASWVGVVVIGLGVFVDAFAERAEQQPSPTARNVALICGAAAVLGACGSGLTAIGFAVVWAIAVIRGASQTPIQPEHRGSEAQRRVGQGVLGVLGVVLLGLFSGCWRYADANLVRANASDAWRPRMIQQAWSWSGLEAACLLVMLSACTAWAIWNLRQERASLRSGGLWMIPLGIPVVAVIGGLALYGRWSAILTHAVVP